MILIIKKWYKNEKKFNLVSEILDYRKIPNKISFSDNNSYLTVECNKEEYKVIDEEVFDHIFPGREGGEYTLISGKANLNEPLSVISFIEGYPKFYYAKLRNNYLKEKEESINIYKNKKIYGFMKFDPNEEFTIKSDFIVTNCLHSVCKSFNIECRCYQGEEDEE